ncbi:MAG: hypothetical protein HDR01_10880 [Lachnospiraceae bacterium]|nr:hypothetical protein [Lachnospiraceae bacterium]
MREDDKGGEGSEHHLPYGGAIAQTGVTEKGLDTVKKHITDNGFDVHDAALEFFEVSPFSVYHPDVIKLNPRLREVSGLNLGE